MTARARSRTARGRLRRAAALALPPLALLAAGCAKPLAEANLPAVPIPPELPAVSAPPPERAPAPALPPPPIAVVPPPAPPPRPAPPRPVPPVAAPAPPAPTATPVVPPPAAPAPLLSARVGSEEERRLTQAAQTRIDDTEKIVGRLDQRRLGKPHQETFATIQSFLVKAKEAITAKDYQRAYTLADKAQILAEQLAQAVR